MQEAPRDPGYFLDRVKKRGFIRLGRLVETGDFPYELQRSSADFFVSDWRIEIEERFYISAHLINSLYKEERTPAVPGPRR